MACGCKKRGAPEQEYVWIPPEGSVDGEGTVRYSSELMAKAKVARKGGTYVVAAPLRRPARR